MEELLEYANIGIKRKWKRTKSTKKTSSSPPSSTSSTPTQSPQQKKNKSANRFPPLPNFNSPQAEPCLDPKPILTCPTPPPNCPTPNPDQEHSYLDLTPIFDSYSPAHSTPSLPKISKLKRGKGVLRKLLQKKKCNMCKGCLNTSCNICKDCRAPNRKRRCLRTRCYTLHNASPSTRKEWRKTWRKSVERSYEEIRLRKLDEGIAHLILPCEKSGYDYPGQLDTSTEEINATYSPSMSIFTPLRQNPFFIANSTPAQPTFSIPLPNLTPLTPVEPDNAHELSLAPDEPNPPSFVNLSNPDLLLFLDNVSVDYDCWNSSQQASYLSNKTNYSANYKNNFTKLKQLLYPYYQITTFLGQIETFSLKLQCYPAKLSDHLSELNLTPHHFSLPLFLIGYNTSLSQLPDIDPTQQVHWNYGQQASNFNIKTNQFTTHISYITNSHNFSSCPILKLFNIIGLKEVTNAFKQGYPTKHAITPLPLLHYRVHLLYQESATCASNNTRLIDL